MVHTMSKLTRLLFLATVHRCTAYGGRRKAWNKALRSFMEVRVNTSQRSFVVVGAHLFHQDHNDPLSRLMRDLPWAAVLLIEANPSVAEKLGAAIAAHNPFSRTAKERVFVSNAGVCPTDMLSGQTEVALPFHSLNVSGRGLPLWATQAGSFHKPHMTWAAADLADKSNGQWSRWRLARQLVTTKVPCRALPEELRWWRRADASGSRATRLPPPAVLLMDAEALDCRIVESHDFCAGALRPELLVYEYAHCTKRAQAAARTRLGKCPGFASPAFQDSENIYFTTSWIDSPKSA